MKIKRDGNARAEYAMWRPQHDDRKLQSINDWYGLGVVVGVTGVPFPKDQRVNWFCGQGARDSSYFQGLIDGRKVNVEANSAKDVRERLRDEGLGNYD